MLVSGRTYARCCETMDAVVLTGQYGMSKQKLIVEAGTDDAKNVLHYLLYPGYDNSAKPPDGVRHCSNGLSALLH